MLIYRIEHPNGDGIWFNRNGNSRKPNSTIFIDKDITGWLSGCMSFGMLRRYFSKQEWNKYRGKGCVIAIYHAIEVKQYFDASKNDVHLIFHPRTARRIKQIQL